MMIRPSKMTVNLKLNIRPASKSITSVCRMKRKLHTHRTVRMMLPKILLNPLLTKRNSFQGGYPTDKIEGSGSEPDAMYCSTNAPIKQLLKPICHPERSEGSACYPMGDPSLRSGCQQASRINPDYSV